MRLSDFFFEQADKPTTAYHVTTRENANEIMYGGLNPRDGKVYLVVDSGDRKKLQDEISMVANWIYARTEGSDDPLTLLKVNIQGIPLKYEFGWHTASAKIPPNRIQDLGDDGLAKYV